jgi:hypothetical protein
MLAGFVFLFGMSGIQTRVSGETGESKTGKLSPQELEKVVGPIALYPDDLVGIVLPASTNTLQVVQAARFLQKQKKDSSLKPDKDWDPSVLGLLNYPEVINLMNEDLEWTQKLGDAVINQQKDVMAAIQQFRDKAEAAGNLKSNDKQVIVHEKEIIKIVSANPEVIYVPTYQPTTVIYTTTPVYYAAPRPVYYSPGAAFFTGMFVGSAIRYGTGWGRGDIDINRNVNISGGDRTTNIGGRGGSGTRPSQRPGGGRGGGGQQWKPSQGASRRTAARTQPAQRPSSRGGSQLGSWSGSRTGSRPSSRSGYQGSRSGGKSSFGGYKSGGTARANSSRGSRSRASSSRSSRSSRSMGGSRGSRGGSRGGGRSRGGGGGRRR